MSYRMTPEGVKWLSGQDRTPGGYCPSCPSCGEMEALFSPATPEPYCTLSPNGVWTCSICGTTYALKKVVITQPLGDRREPAERVVSLIMAGNREALLELGYTEEQVDKWLSAARQ